MHICVVDDDLSVRRALGLLLRSAGFAVETFASAEAFLGSKHETRYDCLVLDVHLGGLSGFALQERLASAGRSIPIVFITAHDDPATRERARAEATAEYLRKPVDDQSLIGAIDRLVRGGPRPGEDAR
jgi:FixJ family two-component response regulator